MEDALRVRFPEADVIDSKGGCKPEEIVNADLVVDASAASCCFVSLMPCRRWIASSTSLVDLM